jgi:ADP-ribose pyrophosphatase YjhB (NUDIX family)
MKIYSKYKKHLVAVDCIVFGYDIIEKQIKLLLIKRNFKPAKGKWSLAGGFVDVNESLDDAAYRILSTLTGLENIYMNQSYSYGDPERDPGARVISIAFSALITIRDIDQELAIQNKARWRSITDLPNLVFDHSLMVENALSDLQDQIKAKPVGFELLPEKFTLVQLQDLYEAISQKTLDRRNFRKKIMSMGILEKLEEKEKQTSKRGAFFYKFNKEKYEELKKSGTFFNLDVN